MDDADLYGTRSIEEKYCPYLGHNVAFKIMRCGNTDLASKCLELNNCDNDLDYCVNKLSQ